MIWEVVVGIVSVLWGAASRNCSKQLVAFSCSSRLDFYRCVLLGFM